MAVAKAGVSLKASDVEVDVAVHVGASARASSCLHGAVVSCLAVLLQYDVNDAGASLGAEFCRRVVYHLYSLYALRRQLLKDFGAVVACQSACLSVDPYLHAGVAAQRYVAVSVNLYRRDVLQHVCGVASGIGDVLRNVERLAVNLEPHCRPLCRHRNLFERLAVVVHVDLLKVHVPSVFGHAERFFNRGVAYVGKFHGVVAIGQLVDVEQAFLV